MAAITEVSLPTEEFALEVTLDIHPEAHIEIDPTVEDVVMFSDTGDERSYQMTWTGSIDFIVQVLTEHSGTITHADGSADGWNLRVVFPDRETLSRAHESAQEAGFQFDVRTIYGTEDARDAQHGLTETQRNTLVTAFESEVFHRATRDVVVGISRATGFVSSSTLGTAQTSNGQSRRVDAHHSRRPRRVSVWWSCRTTDRGDE